MQELRFTDDNSSSQGFDSRAHAISFKYAIDLYREQRLRASSGWKTRNSFTLSSSKNRCVKFLNYEMVAI